jgi:hypothetical protein
MPQMTLWVGTAKGLLCYRADASAREGWRMDEPILPGWEVSSVGIVRAPNAAPRLIVGTKHYAYGATLRVSDDLGKSWRQVEHGPAFSGESGFKLDRIWQVEQDAHDPKTVWAGVDEAALFISKDRGETWSLVEGLSNHPTRKSWQPGGGGLCLHTIIPDPSNAKRLWVAISAVGCFRTDDGGKSWAIRNNGLPNLATGSDDASAAHCVHKIVQHATKPDTLFMQYHGGVFKTTDAADTWTKIEHGLPGNFGFPMVMTKTGVLCIAPLGAEEMRVFKDGHMAIYRSTNEGESWTATSTGLPEESFVGVLRDAMVTDDNATDPGVYFGTTMGHVYASRDAGASWTRLPGELPRVMSVRTCVIG